jgi:hypothetical protein
MEGRSDMDKSNLKGVRGWLLLLCLNLTVFGPPVDLVTLFMAFNSAASEVDLHPEKLRLALIAGVPTIALAVFSLYAGFCLWKALPGAVALARKYLVCLFFFSVLSLLFPGIVGMTEEAYPGLAEANSFAVAITFGHIAAWYLYLKFSKRVKTTYGDQGS